MIIKLAYSQLALANLLIHLSSGLLRLPLFHLLAILHLCPYKVPVLVSSVSKCKKIMFENDILGPLKTFVLRKKVGYRAFLNL
jgi:hypothetical protein